MRCVQRAWMYCLLSEMIISIFYIISRGVFMHPTRFPGIRESPVVFLIFANISGFSIRALTLGGYGVMLP